MRPFEPLDEEERALAALIAREGPHAEPSPALDAKILAAAHSAVAARPSRHAPRWPLWTGVAASALLAVGIAWQLRPAHEIRSAQGHADAPLAAVESTPSELPAEAANAPSAAPAIAPPPSAAPAAPVAEPAPPPKPQAIAPKPASPALAPPAPPPPPAPVADTAADRVFAAEPPAAIAAARGEAEAFRAQTQAENARARSAKAMREAAPSPPAPPAPAPAAAAAGDATLDSIVVLDAKSQSTLAAVPVAEDAKLSRRKWLRRIEQRHAQGDDAGARESLRRFVEKHPRTELPPELRGLLEE
ncbi:MAG: hypothetical protein QM761_08785 [Pseudoxanthomonas sp.]